MRKQQITISPQELSRIPDYAGLSRTSLYRHYRKIRQHTGAPSYRYLNIKEIAQYLGVEHTELQKVI
jgi:predicted DNA-binding transcriptional regulator AlpA